MPGAGRPSLSAYATRARTVRRASGTLSGGLARFEPSAPRPGGDDAERDAEARDGRPQDRPELLAAHRAALDVAEPLEGPQRSDRHQQDGEDEDDDARHQAVPRS